MTTDPEPHAAAMLTNSREELIADTFVHLADSLVDDYDVIELLDFLTERCAWLLGIDEAGVVLVDGHGHLQLISSTSARMRHVELFEIQSQEGPCQDAYRTGEPSLVDDLDLDARWPQFGPQANVSGFRSAYGLPMRLRGQTIGALNLFGNQPGTLDPGHQRLGQAFADAATIGILHERSATDRSTLNAQLQGALDSRVAIEQAKGIISAQADCDLEGAFAQLRGYARSRNLGLTRVALSVVAGELNHTTISPTAGT